MFEWLFSDKCAACEARDYHIASLKEELRARDAVIETLEAQIDSYTTNQNDIIKHITGMSRLQNAQPSELTSVPRKSSMGSRIQRAEQAEKNDALNVQRRKEYNERVEKLINPEIELIENKDAG